MATHSHGKSWEFPWTEESGGIQYAGTQRVGHNLVTDQQQHWNRNRVRDTEKKLTDASYLIHAYIKRTDNSEQYPVTKHNRKEYETESIFRHNLICSTADINIVNQIDFNKKKKKRKQIYGYQRRKKMAEGYIRSFGLTYTHSCT